MINPVNQIIDGAVFGLGEKTLGYSFHMRGTS
jgi:hypothetical protein